MTKLRTLATGLIVISIALSGCGGVSMPSHVRSIPGGATMNEMASGQGRGPGMAGDRYSPITETPFVQPSIQPLSTFSIDVDTASYSKARTYLLERQTLPPSDSIRIEEFINYFDYAYAGPTDGKPFAMHIETASTPWHPKHRLVRVALQGKEIHHDRPAANLVFLIDVSGSMDYPNKLPLVKEGLRILVSQLSEHDRVAIVVYAGAAGLVLPPTRGDQRQVIESAIDNLHAGGSTNGGQGIQLAYRIARENRVARGVNRVILCSDGDFNVGTTNTGALVQLAAEQARNDIFLSVLGFGTGNLNDAMLEELSNKADGNYAFVDSSREAKKILADQIDGTLVTIAKDVKLQVEFNPKFVASYRLIGYENRRLEARDFNDDQKDAGDIGAGHTVTAFYEVVPIGAEPAPEVDALRYQTAAPISDAEPSDELLTVKVRYKTPDEDQSQLIVEHVHDHGMAFYQASCNFRFGAAVAAFGMLLRGSEHRGQLNYADVRELAIAASEPGDSDSHRYRAEFLELVDVARRLAGEQSAPTLHHSTNSQSENHSFHGGRNFYGGRMSTIRDSNGRALLIAAIFSGFILWMATIVVGFAFVVKSVTG